MDVYHRVLHKLVEETGGRDSKAVDFRDLVKKLGFHGNYNDIFERLSREGWIIETAKADFVSLTHWGAMEAKKSASAGNADEQAAIRREVTKTQQAAKELAALLENFTSDLSKENFLPIEKKFGELQILFAQTKTKLS